MAKVYIHEGGSEQVYELFDDTPEVTFGRGAGNDVQIADTHASKMHLSLRRVRGRWRLVDLESKNGTRVNGAFKNVHWLSQGDSITVGSFVVRFDAEGQPHGAPPARAAAPVAARPAPTALPARPAAAVAPARPAAATGAARPAAAAPAAAPLVTMRAPAAAPRAPASAPAPSPTRSAPRSGPRRRDEEGYDDEEDVRPVRRPTGMPGWVIALLIGVGVLIVGLVLNSVMSGSNANSSVREQAQQLREKRQYKQALEVLKAGIQPDQPGASAALEEMEQLKVMIAQEALGARESEVFEFFNKSIARVIAVGRLRPAGHPSDQEAAQILRRFFAQYGDTQLARTMLYAKPTENAQYAGYQQIMRENPDAKRDDKQALTELDAAVAPLVQQSRLGAAYERVQLSITLERLSLSPEAFAKFEPRAQAQLQAIAQQARDLVDRHLQEGRSLAARGETGLARTKMKTLMALLAWPEPDLQRHVDDATRTW
jgi:hypothetical protein